MKPAYLFGGGLLIYPLFLFLAELFKLGRFIPWHPQPSILYCLTLVGLFLYGLIEGRRWEDADL